MQDRINKPRVFLSHSKKDAAFVEGKIDPDLRRCQIDPWIDTAEIRDGRSWQQMIFGEGIPTCDAVLVYFTEHSLASKMVGREVDAALVEQLRDQGVTFLPYVSASALRNELRSDIRTLHTREWNESNYLEVLPRVVAEIWRSYLERTVAQAVAQEKLRRLEMQEDLRNSKDRIQGTLFKPAEEQDFTYIFSKLDKPIT